MVTLQTLAPDILEHILWFLPQQLLLNLALTNYHFYEPCLIKLYRNLVIQASPVLKPENCRISQRGIDFIDLIKTTIYGLTLVSKPRKAHWKMVSAKVQTLFNSIQVNPTLAQYIEKIEVKETFSPEVTQDLYLLFQLLASVPNSLHKIYIADHDLRQKLQYHSWKRSFALTSVTVDDLAHLSDLALSFPDVEEIIVAGTGHTTSLRRTIVPTLKKLVHIFAKDDLQVFNVFSGALWDLYKETPFTLDNLKTFNVVHDHQNWTHGFPYVDFAKLENFQLSLGCSELEMCGQECLEMGLIRFEFRALKRLSLIQNTPYRYNNHTNSEKWDLIVFSFIESIIETSKRLKYLSIRHNIPPDGIIDDGIEGLYLRKVKLYTQLLPELLGAIKSHPVNLVLPNFMASLSCYEQAMNSILWNGCKCIHCQKYLERLDNFLLYHRFYYGVRGVFKDLRTTQLIRCMSEALAERMDYDYNVGDLFQLSSPMKSVTWNFHDNKFTVPFRCLPRKTYEMEEMEDELQEVSEGQEKYFDADDTVNDCVFLHIEKFIPNYTTVLAHFIDELVRKMVQLNRGDAEDVDTALSGEVIDAVVDMNVRKLVINGIDYNLDRELNGTIFFTNSFDTHNGES